MGCINACNLEGRELPSLELSSARVPVGPSTHLRWRRLAELEELHLRVMHGQLILDIDGDGPSFPHQYLCPLPDSCVNHPALRQARSFEIR